ncbi:MAG TPA: transcription termination factor Rho [Acidimicrobiales bacterium]|nr:transcription termination factor Rho [Acidimicrobiales bacterium]
MTAEQQLERSVLESKERDELQAIAQAMSLRTTSRTKKSDIIDRILQATGVITASGGGEPAPVAGPSGHVAGTTNGAGPTNGAPATNGAGSPGETSGLGEQDGARAAARRGRSSVGPGRADQGEAGQVPADASGGAAAGEEVGAPASANVVTAADSASPLVPAAVQAEAARSDEDDGRVAVPDDRDERTGQARASGDGVGHAGPVPATHLGRAPGRVPQGTETGRRGRRRRGRERTGGERDLQGAGQDAPYQGELIEVRGLLDLRDEGYGFLRCDGYLPSSKDVYVSISQARRFSLRKGDYVEGACRPASNNEKYPALLRIDSVSGLDPEAARNRSRFEDLTPLFPDERLTLELPGAKDNITARIIDLLAPIGKGQRGLIVSPPKAGKTTIMKQIAHSIEANNPEVHLMVLLVDERPEEVTDMRRSVAGEVVASTFDRPSEEHTAVAELAIERAKRLVELGKDVVIILDGITRLARAYNLAAPATGRIMSGGVDSGALYPPKKFFGAARNIEEGGSLTILATALVETGSKMDEVIFEEFKGTGNMELRLDRRLAERRLYPSIDVNGSSTRHEELLFDRGQLQQVWKLRRVLNALASEGSAASGLELLMDKIRTTKSNDEFLAEIAKSPAPSV